MKYALITGLALVIALAAAASQVINKKPKCPAQDEKISEILLSGNAYKFEDIKTGMPIKIVQGGRVVDAIISKSSNESITITVDDDDDICQ